MNYQTQMIQKSHTVSRPLSQLAKQAPSKKEQKKVRGHTFSNPMSQFFDLAGPASQIAATATMEQLL
jgi:hypothetical protein